MTTRSRLQDLVGLSREASLHKLELRARRRRRFCYEGRGFDLGCTRDNETDSWASVSVSLITSQETGDATSRSCSCLLGKLCRNGLPGTDFTSAHACRTRIASSMC